MSTASPKESIEALIERHRGLSPEGLNEAATRLLFIDTMLRDVLGWPSDSFNPEEKVSSSEAGEKRKKTEWIDYHLKTGETLRLVVEAKRSGKTFAISSTQRRRIVPLHALQSNYGETLSKAISQAQAYAVKVGTYGFVVTNGAQWIASLAFAHNVPAEKINAVVFYDLEDIRDNLGEFSDLLSPHGLAGQTLMARAVSSASLVPAFAQKLNSIYSPSAPANKNYLAQPMAALMRVCFGDLTDDEHVEMLRKCYVTSEVTDANVRKLEPFASATLPNAVPAGSEKLARNSENSTRLMETARANGTAVLVVGRAGSGKSTFLAVTRDRLSQYGIRDSHVLLHADLLPRTQIHAQSFDHDRLVDEVCTDLLIQAERSYPAHNPFAYELLEQIFSGEITRLRNSLAPETRESDDAKLRINTLIQDHLKKPLQHLKAYLGYLDRCDIFATILLDNVDRGTVEFERVTFQLAQTLAQYTRATVATSLRDTTYQEGRVAGFLDVARQTVVTISPPPFVEVAKLRFEYVRARLREDLALSRTFLRACAGSPTESVLQFADTLAHIVLGQDSPIQSAIQALAGTNVRRALEFLEDFATSPNTDLDKLFAQFQRADRSGRPELGPSLDMFLRSVMCMRADRYAEGDSKIYNLFEVVPNVLSSHFDAIRILQFLNNRFTGSRRDADCSVEDLVRHLGVIGHAADNVVRSLNHMGRYGLVLSLTRAESPWSRTDTVRISASGIYYLQRLIFQREYVKNVIDDTIIYDAGVFNALEEVQQDRQRDWQQKLDAKARIFLAYLIRREDDELTKSGAPAVRPIWATPVASVIGSQHLGDSFVKSVRGQVRRGH